jgi:hypothetical protein
MTEQEYMDTIDLANVRAATALLLGVFCQHKSAIDKLLIAIRALDDLDEMLYRKVDSHIDVKRCIERTRTGIDGA